MRWQQIFVTLILLPIGLFAAKPGGVDDAQLWLRADQGVSGSPVSLWEDQSGNHWNATQSNGTYQPTWTQNIANFNPALYFTDHYLDVAYHSELNEDNLTVFTVVLSDGGSGYRSPWTTRDDPPGRRTTAGHILYLEDGGTYSYWNGHATSSWQQLDTTTAPGGNYEILTTKSSTHTANSTIDKRIYYQGVNVGSKNNVVFSPNPQRPFRIGKGATEDLPAHPHGRYPWHGYITETIVFNSALSTTDRNKVESYLALKYGITLTQPQDYRDCSSSIVWSASTNSGFGNDIAGLSLDVGTNCSALDQRVSRSINKDAVITMATNSDFASANLNPGSRPALSSSSGRFLIWSNDDGGATWQSSGAPRGGEILDRTWKVQKTGSQNSISLQVNVDESAFDIAAFSGKLYFVHGSDLSQSEPLPMTDDGGGLWHIDNIDFQDGDLFSFVINIPEMHITKTSCVIDDPVNDQTNPKRIPGATIRYAIEVSNTGSGNAGDVIVDDNLSGNFDENTITNLKIDDSHPCDCLSPTAAGANGSDGGISGNQVKLDFDTVSAGETECGYFEVEIR